MHIGFQTFVISFQVAEGIPKPSDNDPIDFSDINNVIIFIVVPIVLVIFYYFWRKGKSKGE